MLSRRILFVLLAVALSSTALVGCAGEDRQPGQGQQPIQEPARPEGEDGPPASEGQIEADAEAITRQRCSTCHPYTRVEQQSQDRAGWEQTVDRMIQQNGAQISPEEREIIIDYLTERDGG
jgi:hypothetical protein